MASRTGHRRRRGLQADGPSIDAPDRRCGSGDCVTSRDRYLIVP